MSADTRFYARFDNVSSAEWEYFEGVQGAEDLTGLGQFWSEDPGYSEEEKHSAFRAIIGGEFRNPGSLRDWVIRLRALILLCEVSPRAVDDYLQSEAGKQFAMSLSDLCVEVFGEFMGGEIGRRTLELLDSFVLEIPLAELESGDTRNLGEVLRNVEELDDYQKTTLMQRVRMRVDGDPSANSEHSASVRGFCQRAADVYTWLYFLDLRAAGAVEVIAEHWEDTVARRVEEEDGGNYATAGDPSLADRVTGVMELALLNEYDEYASRYGVGLEQWEDWCQEALAFLQKL